MDGTSDTLRSLRSQLAAPPLYRRGIPQLIKIQPNPATGAGYTRIVPGEYWERYLSVAFTLATSATAGIRTLSYNYADGDGYIYNSTPISNEVGPSQSFVSYGDLNYVTPVEIPESHENEGSSTTPVAGTTIATVTLPSGGWTLNWTVGLSGTTSATDVNNFGLYNGSTLLLQSVNGDTAQQDYPQLPIDVQVPVGGATFNVKNIALATTGAVYAAQLVATPSNVVAAQFTIPDLVIPAGHQVQLAIGNAQAGDAITAIGFLTERYASNYANGGVEDIERREIEAWIAGLARSGG